MKSVKYILIIVINFQQDYALCTHARQYILFCYNINIIVYLYIAYMFN